MKIVRVCLNCGEIFPKPLGYLHRNAGDFCDRQCYLAWCDCQESVYEAGEPVQEAIVQGYQNLALAILLQAGRDRGAEKQTVRDAAICFLHGEYAQSLAEDLGFNPDVWEKKRVHLDAMG